MHASSSTPYRSRRRTAGQSGPAQDPGRDVRILDAAVELLAEGGFNFLTMERVAARAAVGKATVYRRWLSPAELAAEAFEYAGVVNEPNISRLGKGRLRDELVATLAETARCGSHGSRAGLVATMLETGRLHPEVAQALQHRYLHNLCESIVAVLRNAADRGDIPVHRLGTADERPIQIDAAIALILHWQIIHTDGIEPKDIEHLVDGILLPAFSELKPNTNKPLGQPPAVRAR